MVLWYDIAKQCATNESMAENPILKDLSGNGHDATCYNFAWSGMSGIGGYATNWRNYTNYKNRATYTLTQNKLHITNVTTVSNIIETNTDNNPIDSVIKEYKVKITGLDKLNEQGNSAQVKYRKNQDEKTSIYFDKDGTYTIEENVISTPYSDGYAIFNYVGDCDITIEQLPQYPNALVSDGVDDYAYVEGLPILTDYTVIAKREYIETNRWSCLASTSAAINTGASVIEQSHYCPVKVDK